MTDDLKKLIDDMSPEEKLLVLSFFSGDREEFLFAASEAKSRYERADGYPADKPDLATRDQLADRELDLSRRRTAHFQKLYEGALDELDAARTKFAALDALHPHTELDWWHPCKAHSILDEESTLNACPNCLAEPVMGCPRCDDACEIRAILHPDSPDVTL